MKTLMIVAGWLFVLNTIAYLYAITKFYGIVNSERPEWVQRRGSLSFLYDGLPRLGDPNVTMAVIRTAFSPRANQLTSPLAGYYARRVRVLLPAGLALFAFILFAMWRAWP